MYPCLLLLFVTFCHRFATPFAPSWTPLLQVSPSNPRQSIYSSSPLLHACSLLIIKHPLLFPFLAIVVCPMPSCRVLSKSLPASQAGRTSGYNLLGQLSALPVRNRTPKDIPQRTSPGPSAASCEFFFSLPFSFHPATVLHLLS